MKAHVIVVATKRDALPEFSMSSALWHRWSCACGKHGDWTASVRSARTGGEHHRAKMDKQQPKDGR